MIDTATSLYCIIGDPVGHSKSPAMHNAGFGECGINAVYLAFHLHPDTFTITINGLKKLAELKGMNITVPYKKEILPFIDQLDETAKKIGTVNTIHNQDGLWIGYNTDWYGVYMTLTNHSIPHSVKTLVIGAGGATNALLYGLKYYGIQEITIANRTRATAELLATQYGGIEVMDLANVPQAAEQFNFIINTTTVGFKELLPKSNASTIYYDLKYYINNDGMLGTYIDGKEMLLYQGVKAFELWTNQKAPVEIMKRSIGM